MDDNLIQIAVSLGDPSGVGPEILLSVLGGIWETPPIRIKIFGPRRVLFDCAAKLVPVLYVSNDAITGGCLECVLDDECHYEQIRWTPGKPTSMGARAAWTAIDRAIESVKSGESAALVTGPIHKGEMRKVGFPEPGHTTYLATRTGARNPVMLYDSPRLKTALVTTHIPLHEVPSAISKNRIIDVARQVNAYLKQLKILSPRIALAGLNPHAGSGDHFGTEEKDILVPAVKTMQEMGIPITGPYPPDTIFYRTWNGEFDAIVALYHDQASIPVKTMAFDKTVNVTLGLPIIRTSVDHGTAFDIAGLGKASCINFKTALELAARLARHQK